MSVCHGVMALEVTDKLSTRSQVVRSLLMLVCFGVIALDATNQAVHKVKSLPESLDIGTSLCHGPGGHGSRSPQGD